MAIINPLIYNFKYSKNKSSSLLRLLGMREIQSKCSGISPILEKHRALRQKYLNFVKLYQDFAESAARWRYPRVSPRNSPF